jgi:nucleoside-diphosphate-sugar epimerase
MTIVAKKTLVKTKIFIIGGNSRLAKALGNYYSENECNYLKREIYEDWFNENKKLEIRNFFESKITEESIIFITSGILNSNSDTELLNNVNYHLPWNIIKSLEGLNIKIVTFGTILEKLVDSTNPYVKSKISLSKKIDSFSSKLTKVIHFRIHTLYGYGYPNDFMFLGQLYNAIKNNKKFNMSAGYQIREYHHLDDVAESVDIILSKNEQGIIELTNGNGIKLRDLATGVFKEFNALHLLNIGSLDIQHKDKFANDYTKNKHIELVDFRNPIQGVCDYLRSIL